MKSEFESPWQRLPWTLASALLAWVILLWAFGEFMSRPERLAPVQKPIDAKLIEIPAPPKESKPPSPRQVKREALPKKVAVQPKVETRPEPAHLPPKIQPKIDAPPKAPPPPPPLPPQHGTPGGDVMGARAIYSPKPQIPDEFRQDAMDALVVARFHISADGSIKVELITATPNPELNRTVLDTLNTWKFFPAMRDGKPVASSQDVRFRLVVK